MNGGRPQNHTTPTKHNQLQPGRSAERPRPGFPASTKSSAGHVDEKICCFLFRCIYRFIYMYVNMCIFIDIFFMNIHICVYVFRYIYIYLYNLLHIYIIYWLSDYLKRGYCLIIQQLAWFQKHSAEVIQPWIKNGTTKISWEISEFHPTFRFLSQNQKPKKKNTQHHNTLQQGPNAAKQTSASSLGTYKFSWDDFFSPKKILALHGSKKT